MVNFSKFLNSIKISHDRVDNFVHSCKLYLLFLFNAYHAIKCTILSNIQINSRQGLL